MPQNFKRCYEERQCGECRSEVSWYSSLVHLYASYFVKAFFARCREHHQTSEGITIRRITLLSA
jgi:hypothetical protein